MARMPLTKALCLSSLEVTRTRSPCQLHPSLLGPLLVSYISYIISGNAPINMVWLLTGTVTFVGRPELDTKVAEKQTPVDLSRFLVRSLTSHGDTVLDLFGGVGTTSTAAIYEGRNAVYADKDFSRFTSARARVGKLLDNEAAKAAFLKVVLGGETGEQAKEMALQYAKGTMVDPYKPSEAAVDELMNRLGNRGTFASLSESWEEQQNMKVSEEAVKDLIRAWFMGLDKPTFESVRGQRDGSAVRFVMKLDPSALMGNKRLLAEGRAGSSSQVAAASGQV
jgi:hypothetical protein